MGAESLPLLSRRLIREARFQDRPDLGVPGPGLFDLPVKVFQIGLGGYIRGHADVFLHDAIAAGAYGGRAAAIQPNSVEAPRKLAAQDNLYTVVSVGGTEARPEFRYKIVGSLACAVAARERWAEALSWAEGEIDLVTMVVTESGVRPDPADRLDAAPPRSAMGKLTAFLHRRWQSRPNSCLAVLDSDNVAENGEQVREAVLAMADAWGLGGRFRDWLRASVTFPVTLGDRMVPGFPRDEAVLRRHWEALGYRDEGMVLAEPFSLWVVEDRFPGRRPALDAAGVKFVTDVRAYERMKIAILNGAHTGLVHAAALMGVAYVRDAVRHPLLRPHAERLMFREVAPYFEIAGEDPTQYARDALARFANPHLDHTTYQICTDGSTKARHRLIPSLVRHVEKAGATPPHLAFAVSALLRYLTPAGRGEAQDAKGTLRRGVLGRRDDGTTYLIDDPRADLLSGLPLGSGSDRTALDAVLGPILADASLWGVNLRAAGGAAEAVQQYYAEMRAGGVEAALRGVLGEGGD
ncbi:MAG: hypothetical protein A3F84_00945 [Candidatus Handelsmanbacteria bacterium RIFCSPLOWO2_12_FULL_64_10]|uniref:Mannitol dehydrogenase C-terminal domain-containing protein n=1 Tax=Handelsmanbacteria sp. (strain RIFCSPLOWO2_12_FULL_64_10) TaxID=1817868 RepID=A0A1F6C5B0_HANXR|nr:MAG: hypothetical protein A3F84_00945 [Candidatus Handelsmanbacteria bacterium RIFCSPLOWO2_12_FULL_64_10]